MDLKFISTPNLLFLIFTNKKKFIQARLVLKNLSFTHFFYYDGRNIFDEGIDGEERRVTPVEILKRYFNNYWLLEDIV